MPRPAYQIEWIDFRNAGLWDEFVLNSSRGTVFHTSAYLSVLKEVFAKKPQILAVKRGKEIVAGVALLPEVKYAVNYCGSPFYFPYNGIIHSDFPEIKHRYRAVDLQTAATGMILQTLEKSFHAVEMVLPPNFPDLRPFVWKGWEVVPEYSVSLHLEKGKDYFLRMDPAQKRKIISLKNLRFAEASEKPFEKFWEFHSNVYRLHGSIPPLSKEHFSRYLLKLLQSGLGKIYLFGEEADQPLALAAVVEGKNKAYALVSGRAPGKKSSGAEIALLHRIFEHYTDRGFSEFDLLGGMIPSIAKVKLELGGELVRTDKIRFFKSPATKFLWKLKAKFIQHRRKSGVA